jgi:hypothetical protein
MNKPAQVLTRALILSTDPLAGTSPAGTTDLKWAVHQQVLQPFRCGGRAQALRRYGTSEALTETSEALTEISEAQALFFFLVFREELT